MKEAPIEGQVRGLQTRTEPLGNASHRTVWSFRIERFDTAGNLELLVPVEMRGISFKGSLTEGDRVRVLSGRQKGGTLVASKVRNETTGAVVEARDVPRVVKWFVAVLFLAVAVVFAIGVYLFVVSWGNGVG